MAGQQGEKPLLLNQNTAACLQFHKDCMDKPEVRIIFLDWDEIKTEVLGFNEKHFVKREEHTYFVGVGPRLHAFIIEQNWMKFELY